MDKNNILIPVMNNADKCRLTTSGVWSQYLRISYQILYSSVTVYIMVTRVLTSCVAGKRLIVTAALAALIVCIMKPKSEGSGFKP